MCKECKDYRTKKFGARIGGKGHEAIEVKFTLGELEDITEAITERAMKTKDPENLKLVACFALASSRLMNAHKETTIAEGKYKGFRDAIQDIIDRNDPATALEDLKDVVASNQKVDKLLNDLQEIGIL
jgi:hypothetical protein|uniref:Uncharacterized protein n=1 Tax=Siphoviridae sp. ctaDn21 TaxID=2825563 RepID=A0A8S5UUY0_9CAUD|nr:MAG TPA: hypothetical protein [Siphoviridae sp. ctaDn21]